MERFADHLSTHRGQPEEIEEYCSDMSAAFLQGMQEAFPKAKQTIDKFHVMKLLGDAIDETRRKEQHQALRSSRSGRIFQKSISGKSPLFLDFTH